MPDETSIYWDPYDSTLARDPYPIFRRMREELPVYYNEQYNFFAVSRFADCERGLNDWQTFSSSRGPVLEFIQLGQEIPPGTVICEDPPIHDLHRRLLSGVFTPRRMAALESRVREFCVRALDPLIGAARFDLISALSAEMPMRVIGMLLGIPESEQESIRDMVDEALRTDDTKEVIDTSMMSGEAFSEYIDWRIEHPSDDLMTELLRAEFDDEAGRRRTLTREEALTYVTIVAGAGNETTGRLIGWMASTLAQHPEQRQELVEDPSLIPAAVEEVLRYEPPGPSIARYVRKDAEFHGTKVPEGNAILFLVASANRDESRYPNGESFDIHRQAGQLSTFGLGPHYCLGAALARLEGRVALEELLKRFPSWDVDWAQARLAQTSTVRGWESLPLVIPG